MYIQNVETHSEALRPGEGSCGCSTLFALNILFHTRAVPSCPSVPSGPPLTLLKVPWSLGDPACLWSRNLMRSFDAVLTVTAPPFAWEDQTNVKKKDKTPPTPLLSHCSDCCCRCFKGVFVQKCCFYDCYYNYCYDYLIKDLYRTEEKKNSKIFSTEEQER